MIRSRQHISQNLPFGCSWGSWQRPGGGGLTEAQANALIATALTAAVESNTETGITVTYNTSDGTFDFVVTDAGGQTQAEVDARIVAALTAAVTGNTETGITVTYASGKLNFVVTGGGGGGLTQAQVNTLIADALTAAVTGNTETGITVTYDAADGTFDFVVPATGRTAGAGRCQHNGCLCRCRDGKYRNQDQRGIRS